MTQLAACQLDDGRILFVTDRLEQVADLSMGGGFRLLPNGKGQTVPWVQTLMWSWAGPEEPRRSLDIWMKNEARSTDWPAFCETAQAKMLDVFETHLEQGKYLTGHLLVAGFLDGQPGILRVEHFGDINWDSADVPLAEDTFAGRSYLGLAAAWDYVNANYPPTDVGKAFRDLVRYMIRNDRLLGGFAAWHIPPVGEPARLLSRDGD